MLCMVGWTQLLLLAAAVKFCGLVCDVWLRGFLDRAGEMAKDYPGVSEISRVFHREESLV